MRLAQSAGTAIGRAIDWALLRRPEQPDDKTLSPDTVLWLKYIPVPVRPLLLSRRYPRIANQLASHWSEASKTRELFDDLLQDRRGDRQGFALEILDELVTLKAFYAEVLAPRKGANVWDDTHMF